MEFELKGIRNDNGEESFQLPYSFELRAGQSARLVVNSEGNGFWVERPRSDIIFRHSAFNYNTLMRTVTSKEGALLGTLTPTQDSIYRKLIENLDHPVLNSDFKPILYPDEDSSQITNTRLTENLKVNIYRMRKAFPESGNPNSHGKDDHFITNTGKYGYAHYDLGLFSNRTKRHRRA